MTQAFQAECFLCKRKGIIHANSRPVFSNCYHCNGLLSIHYKTEQEAIEEYNANEED